MQLSKSCFGAIKLTTGIQFYLEVAPPSLMASLAKQQPKIIRNLILIVIKNSKTVEINHFKKKKKNEFKKTTKQKKPTATTIITAK